MGVSNSPLRDRVVFVEGAPRSGTTWLVTLLATHPDIAGVEAESHLFDFATDRIFDNFEHRHPHLHGLQSYLTRPEVVDLVRDLCDGVLMAMRAHVSSGAEPAFVVEKTPSAARRDGLDLARKAECYPDAWYVHIVRDREAVARSLMGAAWMPDRSHAACAATWDRTVGHIRAMQGGLPRYREVSYESLRTDPAAACRDLFAWLGVAAGDAELEAVRRLSDEPFSDLGEVPEPEPSTREALASAPRLLAGRARAALVRRIRTTLLPNPADSPGSRAAFAFAQALREQDADALRSLTTPSLEVVLRGEPEDRVLRGDHARDALLALAEDAFARRYVSESWASAGGGVGEWWTSAPGKPFWSVFFSALAGDATRVDVAIGVILEKNLIRRVLVISAGPLSGRPIDSRVEAT